MRLKLKHTIPVALAWCLPVITFAAGTATETLQPPFGSAQAQQNPTLIIATVIQALLGVVGAGALLVFIWGGFHMIFSGGNEENIKKGRTILIWAVIGLMIVLSSYAVLNYTFGIFKVASGG